MNQNKKTDAQEIKDLLADALAALGVTMPPPDDAPRPANITQEMLAGVMHRILARAKFPLGDVCMTNGVARLFAPCEVFAALADHAQGKWGDICDEDKAANDSAIADGGRVLSTFTRADDGQRLWIITEASREVTTALLPDEY
jgi:hypothetical protein